MFALYHIPGVDTHTERGEDSIVFFAILQCRRAPLQIKSTVSMVLAAGRLGLSRHCCLFCFDFFVFFCFLQCLLCDMLLVHFQMLNIQKFHQSSDQPLPIYLPYVRACVRAYVCVCVCVCVCARARACLCMCTRARVFYTCCYDFFFKRWFGIYLIFFLHVLRSTTMCVKTNNSK